MPLEETYPAFADKIGKLKSMGIEETEIQPVMQSRIQNLSKMGFSVEEINKALGEIKPPPMTIMEGIGKGMTELPGSMVEMAKSIGKSAVTPPKEGFFSFKPERLIDVAKGALSGATGGIMETAAPKDEAEQARQTLGQLLGMAVPFKVLSGLGKGVGLGKVASGVGAGAAIGAAGRLAEASLRVKVLLSLGECKRLAAVAVKEGVKGAGIVGALELGGQLLTTAFKNVKGKPPTTEAEIVEAAKEPKFVEEIQRLKEESFPAEPPRHNRRSISCDSRRIQG